LITASGEDKPGVSTSLLVEHGGTIFDMGQAVIHETLSLGLLVQVPRDEDWPPVAKEMLFRAYELGLKIKFETVEPQIYTEWVKAQGKERHLVTILGKRLVAFDMDSTLIQAEVIDELAKAAGTGERVARITEAAMRGEIDFQESFRQRLALLKGLEEDTLKEVAERIPLTDGAERLIAMLKRLGYKVALLSGGFTYFGERLGIDYVHANKLEIVDGPRKAEPSVRSPQEKTSPSAPSPS
jgi:HAD superfamily phosphoserine phosphatase-like hydrolase